MIPKDKNQQARQNIEKIIKRTENIQSVLHMWFQYIYYTQQRYVAYCKNIFKDLTSFENKISKASRYEPDKTTMLLRLSRMYRQFPAKIQYYSQVNLTRLPSNHHLQQLKKYELQLGKKVESFQSQFRNYTNTISDYNSIYQQYITHCNTLDQIIAKFKSYNDPIKFYNKAITLTYQQKLQLALNNSKNEQLKIMTQLQLLDSKRKFLDQLVKQIRQYYTVFFHQCLKYIEHVVKPIADPAKDKLEKQNLNKKPFNPSGGQTSSKQSQTYQIQFQRLNTFTNIIDQGNQIMIDFIELMKDKKSSKFNRVIEQHKLFSIRCDNLKKRKEQAYEESLNLYQSLLQMISIQIGNYKEFEKDFKEKEKKIFGMGLGAKETYKKQFEQYFGHKSFTMHQLCFYIIQLPRKSFQKIDVWMIENLNNFRQVTEEKKIALVKFNRLYQDIMAQHLKQKRIYQSQGPSSNEITHSYRSNIVSSLDQFRFIFSELESKEQEQDKIITDKLIQMYKFITKQFDECKIQNIIDSNQQKVLALTSFKLINQAMIVFKSDPVYNIIYEENFGQSLEKGFDSKINKKQHGQAQQILKQKERIAKKMLKRQIGCCGLVKVKPVESEILSSYKCYIYNNNKECPYGTMKILKEGLTFEQSKWNPFSPKVFILVPNSDIHSIETKSMENQQNSKGFTEGISLETVKGSLIFMSSSFDDLFSALQKTYGQTYRKSIAIERKLGISNGGRNDSTSSGSKTRNLNRTSMIVSYNKDQKIFVQEPLLGQKVDSNNKMNFSGSMELKYKNSGFAHSVVSNVNSQQFKPIKPKLNPQAKAKQQKKIHHKLQQIQSHYNKHQFLSDSFIFVSNKHYRSDERKDYEMNDSETHNKFILKELKKNSIKESTTGEVLEILYEWKITYPSNPALRSFKHGQKVIIDLNVKPPLLSITEWPHLKQSIFNRHFFYDHVKKMNQKIRNYIVQNVGEEFYFEQMIEKQYNDLNNEDSEQILPDEFRQQGVSYPEELQIRASRMVDASKYLMPSLENIHLRSSNIANNNDLVLKTKLKKSSVDSATTFLRGSDIERL